MCGRCGREGEDGWRRWRGPAAAQEIRDAVHRRGCDTGTRGNDGYTPLRSTGSNGRREKAGAARSEAGPAEKACTTITAAAAKRTRAGSELLAAGRRIGGSDGAISRRVARVPRQ
ncbi:hypothetical protein AcW1_003932 [Taiwanofungus camphoratus]|nr:hypothetical protein AcW1_003932 [Antrodia cinnamomea]